MPEHLRALIVILVLGTLVYWVASTRWVSAPVAPQLLSQYRNIWLFTTLAAFISHAFWIYMLAMALFILIALRGHDNPIWPYLVMAIAVPPYAVQIPGALGLEHLFYLDLPRLAAIFLLLPAALVLTRNPDVDKFGTLLPDKFVLGYITVFVVTEFVGMGVVAGLRNGIFYSVLDILLPYYVASRGVRTIRHFREVATGFALCVAALSLLAVFELARGWLLYHSLEQAIGVNWGLGNYLYRGGTGLLRAQASLGHSIALGFAATMALGLLLSLRNPNGSEQRKVRVGIQRSPVRATSPQSSAKARGSIPSHVEGVYLSRGGWWLGALLLAGGLLAALARGPWVGALAMVIAFVLLARRSSTALIKLFGGGLVMVFLAVNTEIGRSFIDLLPVFGSVETSNIAYRQNLIRASIGVIEQSPWFGSVHFMSNPLLEVMRQGEGIIDIVNTYLGVILRTGFVGFILWSGVVLTALLGAYQAARRQISSNGLLYELGRSLVATMVGILVVLGTVSGIVTIPLMFWVTVGLLVAYRSLSLRTSA